MQRVHFLVIKVAHTVLFLWPQFYSFSSQKFEEFCVVWLVVCWHELSPNQLSPNRNIYRNNCLQTEITTKTYLDSWCHVRFCGDVAHIHGACQHCWAPSLSICKREVHFFGHFCCSWTHDCQICNWMFQICRMRYGCLFVFENC